MIRADKGKVEIGGDLSLIIGEIAGIIIQLENKAEENGVDPSRIQEHILDTHRFMKLVDSGMTAVQAAETLGLKDCELKAVGNIPEGADVGLEEWNENVKRTHG